MRWGELPAGARYYILYHALVSPTLISWYLLPFYLLRVGYDVVEVGALFTAAHLAGIPVTIALGKLFRKADMRYGLALIDAMDAASLTMYSLAYGPLAPILILAGRLVEEGSSTLYFLYPAYERLIYPEDRMKEALTWHLRVPELSIVISYPIIGYVLGYVCPSTECMRAAFLLMSAYLLLLIPYILLKFEPVVIEKEEDEEGNGSSGGWRKYLPYIMAEVLFIMGWALAPPLALVYLVYERFGGSMFHVALAEASVSAATLVGTVLVDRVSSKHAFRGLSLGTAVTVAGLAALVFLPPLITVLMTAFFIVRLGDTFVFVFKRSWLYSLMSRKETATVSAYLSSIRRLITVISPLVVGLLASIDPRVPYVACMLLLALTIPAYHYGIKTASQRLRKYRTKSTDSVEEHREGTA